MNASYTSVSSDSKFTAKCRLQQSKYREEILKEECGVGPTASSTTEYGNYLIDGDISGQNFVSGCAFRYAQQRVKEKATCKELTIDEYRLFNNMLSSMPLCFNLFSDSRELLLTSRDECTRVVKALFKEILWINSVEYIGVEFIPIPIEQYTGDKTAFDAMLIVKDIDGKKGVISVEVKYTDLLGKNGSTNNELKNQIIEDDCLFNEVKINELKNVGYKQIYRNFLLTYAYAKENKSAHFAHVIVSPPQDIKSIEEMEELTNSLLPKYKNCIYKTDLDEFLLRGIETGEKRIGEVFGKLQGRYVVREWKVY